MQFKHIISHPNEILTKYINPFKFIERRFIDKSFKAYITMI